MHAPTINLSTPHRQTRYQRVMMFFVLMFLALQLIGASSHTHAYTDHDHRLPIERLRLPSTQG